MTKCVQPQIAAVWHPVFSSDFIVHTTDLDIGYSLLDILLVPQTYDLPRIRSTFPPLANQAAFTKLQKFRKRKNPPLTNRIPPLAKTGLHAGAEARTFVSSKQQTKTETRRKAPLTTLLPTETDRMKR